MPRRQAELRAPFDGQRSNVTVAIASILLVLVAVADKALIEVDPDVVKAEKLVPTA